MLFVVFPTIHVFATFGGGQILTEFAYDQDKKMVYFLSNDYGGRGGPPVIMGYDLNAAKTMIVFNLQPDYSVYYASI